MKKLNELKTNDATKDEPFGEEFIQKPDHILSFKVSGFEVRYDQIMSDEIDVTLWDGNKVVGYMNVMEDSDLENLTHQSCYAVTVAKVSPTYQGKNIGYSLYKNLIEVCGWNFTSHDSHSPGAKKLWLRLAYDSNLNCYAYDSRLPKVIHFYDVAAHKYQPTLTLKNGEPIYDIPEANKSMVATRKNSTLDKLIKGFIRNATV